MRHGKPAIAGAAPLYSNDNIFIMLPTKLPSGVHHGLLRSARTFGDLTLVETNYMPELRTRMHTHERSCFAILIGGKYHEYIKGETLECAAGDIVFTPSEVIHSNHISPHGARSLIVEVSDEMISKLRKYGKKDLALTKESYGQVRAVAQRIHQEWQRPDDLTPISLEALTIELWCSFSRRPCEEGKPGWLMRVHDRLLDDFREKLTLDLLAGEVGVHPAHLARTFKHQYSYTIGDFIRRSRIRYAALQIETTDKPLSSIALDSGFSHQAHFSRVFRQIVGTSPGNYRSKFRNCKEQ